jgi:hypothetical protein
MKFMKRSTRYFKKSRHALLVATAWFAAAAAAFAWMAGMFLDQAYGWAMLLGLAGLATSLFGTLGIADGFRLWCIACDEKHHEEGWTR